MTEDPVATVGPYGDGFRRGVDWLYASGCLGRDDWEQLRRALPLEVLEDRYARNEITREEFLRIRSDLTRVARGEA